MRNRVVSTKSFAAKERKEHREKNLCCFFFAIFVFFCGQFSFGCGWPHRAIRGNIFAGMHPGGGGGPQRSWSNFRKGDTQKLKMARRLRQETTMILTWIAQRLNVAAACFLANLLRHASRKQYYAIMRD
jgi:hypothetical protein